MYLYTDSRGLVHIGTVKKSSVLPTAPIRFTLYSRSSGLGGETYNVHLRVE